MARGADRRTVGEDERGVSQSRRGAETEARRPIGASVRVVTGENAHDSDGVVNLTKLVRLSWMMGYLLDETRQVSLSEEGRRWLRDAVDQALVEARSALPDNLLAELSRLAEPLDRHATPSKEEIRVVQAQLAGWIQGEILAVQRAVSGPRVTSSPGPQG
jgi:hypothetical protein